MGIAGYGKTKIQYDMFDLVREAKEARRLSKCEGIYHRGQELAWDGKEILPMLLEQHGGIQVDERTRKALERIFAIILWGELAAWKISAQLADRLVPLEAKMAATSQAMDEARHFYVMHDYLTELGYHPQRLDRAPQALLDMVLDTDRLAYKLLGMQLMIEPIALTVFQTVRESNCEPVIAGLMPYYERDEARHVGLGMQYLPSMMKEMRPREIGALVTFQVRLLAWALAETKLLEPELEVLGLDPRVIVERARRKQLAALQESLRALGVDLSQARNYPGAALNAIVELTFPTDDTRDSIPARARAAWHAFASPAPEHTAAEFDQHHAHRIRTARGEVR